MIADPLAPPVASHFDPAQEFKVYRIVEQSLPDGTVARGVELDLHEGQVETWYSTARITAMIAGSQGGKALPLDTPIPTPDGFTTMGELSVGDTVYDDQGQPCRVLYATEVMHGHTCYRVTFDDGSSIVADADHLWEVQTYEQRKAQRRRKPNPKITRSGKSWQEYRHVSLYSIMTTAEMAACLKDPRGANNLSVRLAGPVDYPRRDLPVPPYTLGAWLGDGSSASAIIHTADKEIVEAIASEGVPVSPAIEVKQQGLAKSYRLSDGQHQRDPQTGQYMPNGSIQSALRDMGLLGNKHIPEQYKLGSIGQRLALLRGLMDTDGYCKPGGRAEFTTVNKRLAEDVVELMRSLGLKPRMKEGRATLYGEDKGPKYRIFVTTAIPIFSLPRKANRQTGGTRPDLFNRYVQSIEPVPSVPVRCIQVDSPTHLYLAGREYIVTHNTTFGPWWLYREIATRGPGDYIAATATYDLFKLKMLPSMLDVFVNVLKVAKYWAGDGILELCEHEWSADDQIWRPIPGRFLATRSDDPMWARIIMRSASSPGGLESATAKGAWLDEAGQDDFTLQAWEAVMRRLSIYRGRVLITTTPYNQGWLKQQVYDRWKAGDRSVHVVQFASIVNPAFPVEEFEDRREKMADWKFRMFYLGQFERPEGLIYSAFIDQPRSEGGHLVKPFPIPQNWPRYVGIDPGPVHTALIWLARDPDADVLYLYRESLEGDKSTREHAHDALTTARDHGENVVQWFLGQKAEKQYRLDWQDAGVYDVAEPPVHDVEIGIDAVIELLKTYRLFVFDTCRGVLDEFGSYQRVLNELDEPTEKIKNKDRYHRLDALRYAVVGLSKAPGGHVVTAPGILVNHRG